MSPKLRSNVIKCVHTDLPSHLPDAVDELDEERRALGVGVVLITVTHPLQHVKSGFFFRSSIILSGIQIQWLTAENLCPKLIHSFSTRTCQHTHTHSHYYSTVNRKNSTLYVVLWPGILWECDSSYPALAWPDRWVEPFYPSHHCSEPPPMFSQTPVCRRSLLLLTITAACGTRRTRVSTARADSTAPIVKTCSGLSLGRMVC